MITNLRWWNTLNNKKPKVCVQRERKRQIGTHFLKTKSRSKKKNALFAGHRAGVPCCPVNRVPIQALEKRQGRRWDKPRTRHPCYICQELERLWGHPPTRSRWLTLLRCSFQKKWLFLGTYWESVWTRGPSPNLRAVAEDRKRKAWQSGSREEDGKAIDSAKSPGCCSGQVQETW